MFQCEEQDLREHRAVHREEQALVCPKETAVLGEIFVPEYPQQPVNFLHTPLFPGEDRDQELREVDD